MYHVLSNGLSAAIVVRGRLIQESQITGFPDVLKDTHDQPVRIVAVTGLDSNIRERVPVVKRASVRELVFEQIEGSLPCPFEIVGKDGEHVLPAIPEADNRCASDVV
jgi:hypothetical protein